MRRAINKLKELFGRQEEDPLKQDVPTSNGNVITSLAHQRELEEKARLEAQNKDRKEKEEAEGKIIVQLPGVKLRLPPKKKTDK